MVLESVWCTISNLGIEVLGVSRPTADVNTRRLAPFTPMLSYPFMGRGLW